MCAVEFHLEKSLTMNNTATLHIKLVLRLWDVSFLGGGMSKAELGESQTWGLLLVHLSLGAGRGCLGSPGSPSPMRCTDPICG